MPSELVYGGAGTIEKSSCAGVTGTGALLVHAVAVKPAALKALKGRLISRVKEDSATGTYDHLPSRLITDHPGCSEARCQVVPTCVPERGFP